MGTRLALCTGMMLVAVAGASAQEDTGSPKEQAPSHHSKRQRQRHLRGLPQSKRNRRRHLKGKFRNCRRLP